MPIIPIPIKEDTFQGLSNATPEQLMWIGIAAVATFIVTIIVGGLINKLFEYCDFKEHHKNITFWRYLNGKY